MKIPTDRQGTESRAPAQSMLLCLFPVGDTVISLELGQLLERKGEAFLGQEGVLMNPFVSLGLSFQIPKAPASSLQFLDKTAKQTNKNKRNNTLPLDRGFPRWGLHLHFSAFPFDQVVPPRPSSCQGRSQHQSEVLGFQCVPGKASSL